MTERNGRAESLREAAIIGDNVKRFASRTFGFDPFQVIPLEADGGNLSRYCMFEVCGIEYRVRDGCLSIHGADDRQ